MKTFSLVSFFNLLGFSLTTAKLLSLRSTRGKGTLEIKQTFIMITALKSHSASLSIVLTSSPGIVQLIFILVRKCDGQSSLQSSRLYQTNRWHVADTVGFTACTALLIFWDAVCCSTVCLFVSVLTDLF